MRLIVTPTAGKRASLTFRLVLRASQPITMSKMFLVASAMPWVGRVKVGWLRDQARRDKVAFAAGRFGVMECRSLEWVSFFVSSLNLQHSQTPRGERRKRLRANY